MVHNVIVIALVLGLFLALCCVSEDDDESAAMAKLAEGFNPKPLGWTTNPTSSVCLWQGVTCTQGASGNVSFIILRNVSLSGFVSSPFLPLPHLCMLDLSNNNLSGEVPSFSNLRSLQVLLLNNNRFNSMTHDFFFGLPPSIVAFELSDNPFLLPWTIPREFSRLKNLNSFLSQNASVTGTLPDIFQSFSNMVTLSLSYNSLNGSLPQSFRDSKIEVLELAHQKMKFTGTIQVISSMFTLSYLDLEGNQFTGPIPDLSKCKKLEAMLLGNNLLTGLVPTSLASLKGLRNISLLNNKLQGPLPTFLSQKAQHLNAILDGNNFCTSNYTSHCDEQVDALLEIAGAFGYPLRLSDAWKGNDACLNWAHVRCNSRREIVMIDMGKQYFGGTISPSFSKLRSLQYLYLNDNNLTGVIPKTLLDLPNLKLLDVSNNDLFGDIPSFKSSVKLITTGNPQLRNLASAKGEKGKMMITIVAIVVIITCGICIYLTGRKTNRHAAKVENMDEFSKSEARLRELNVLLKEEGEMKLQDFQMISYAELVNATGSFHETNKLGQGGFGSVYKGKLEDGQEIAVKRLSNASRQGLEEFMNEVVVISKLQHKNLVRLFGCCITDEEKLLVYEYMPNKSLDALLFDHEKQKVLDWEKRYKIIRGISRGLLYLHVDSRLRIIHRDLKASNILLDKDLNPKISDFGMARIFGANEDHANTKRVMGTYGYMPPEYVMEGRFSERSDIFSFGVLILEIVSGRRNLRPGDDKGLSLLELVWTLWKDNSISTLIDPVTSNSDSNEEILRCIHVGLLCVQDLVKDRPTISMVISMLGSEIEDLPTPKEPLFLAKQDTKNQSQSSSDFTERRVNENGVSLIMGRR